MRGRLVMIAAAAVLVALGIGIGAGPLQHDAAEERLPDNVRRVTTSDLNEQIDHLQDALELDHEFAGAATARVVAGTLEGRKVAVVTFPGPRSKQTEVFDDLVRAAGGEVTAHVRLSNDLFDQGNQGLVDALARQIAAQTPGLSVPAGASAYGVFGALLGRAVGVPPSAHAVGARYDEAAISILSGLQAGKVVASSAVTERAGLTVFVLPDSIRKQAFAPALELLATYSATYPTVVAAPLGSARPGGLLAAVRAGDAVLSTVDSADTPASRIAVVLALAARTRGIKGDFGQVPGAFPPIP